MRRGPAIGGHLPRVSKVVLEQMTWADQSAYHGKRAEVFAARADFCWKLTRALAVISLAFLLVSLILRIVG